MINDNVRSFLRETLNQIEYNDASSQRVVIKMAIGTYEYNAFLYLFHNLNRSWVCCQRIVANV